MRSDAFQVTTNNEAEFFVEGEAYYQLYLRMISSARHTIHLQTYIFELDNFGTHVKKELISAAARGVAVYLLVDDIGSQDLEESVAQEFRNAGVYFCRFNEILFQSWIGNWGRRLHHKILLADDEALVGGINVISVAYGYQNVVPYLDFAVRIKGSVIKELTSYCEKTFSHSYPKPVLFKPIDSPLKIPEGIKLKIFINDWTLWRRQITKQYSQLVKSAKSDIVIINSYFFPRRKFMKQLADAAKRGVRVRLILPKYSDWPSYISASQYLYSYFLKNGVEIYQWENSILHGKMATIDDSSTTIGSFNLNYTGYQQNLEMNVNLYSKEFTQDLNKRIEGWIAESCEKIDGRDFLEKTGFLIKTKRFCFYIILSLVANFSIALSVRGTKVRKN